jgi:hypothetical protein
MSEIRRVSPAFASLGSGEKGALTRRAKGSQLAVNRLEVGTPIDMATIDVLHFDGVISWRRSSRNASSDYRFIQGDRPRRR